MPKSTSKLGGHLRTAYNGSAPPTRPPPPQPPFPSDIIGMVGYIYLHFAMNVWSLPYFRALLDISNQYSCNQLTCRYFQNCRPSFKVVDLLKNTLVCNKFCHKGLKSTLSLHSPVAPKQNTVLEQDDKVCITKICF